MADVIQQKDLKKKPQGTGFTNLQRVFEANKGSRLGEAVGGGIAQQAQGARGATQQAENQFGQQAQSARVDTPESRSYREQVLTQPKDIKDEDVSKFGQFLGGQYAGPKQLETQTVQDLQKKAREAEALGQETQSVGGRLGLLQRFTGGPRYTGGQQRLDQLLLGQQGQSLTEARRGALGLEQNVAQAGSRSAKLADYLQSQAQGFKGETEQAIAARRGEFYNPIEQRTQTAQQAEQQRLNTFQNLKNLLSQNKIDEAMQIAQQQGLVNPEYASQVPALNERAGRARLSLADMLSGRLTQEQAQNVNVAGLATEEEQRQINALSRLAQKSPELASVGGYAAGKTTFEPGDIEGQIAAQEEKIRQAAAKPREPTVTFNAQGEMIGGSMEGYLNWLKLNDPEEYRRSQMTSHR